MKVYDSFIYFVIAVKFIYSVCFFTHLYFVYLDVENANSMIDLYSVYFRDISEVVFIVCMSGLMIFLFNPYMIVNHTLYMNTHTKYLFFIFGLILLFIVLETILEQLHLPIIPDVPTIVLDTPNILPTKNGEL